MRIALIPLVLLLLASPAVSVELSELRSGAAYTVASDVQFKALRIVDGKGQEIPVGSGLKFRLQFKRNQGAPRLHLWACSIVVETHWKDISPGTPLYTSCDNITGPYVQPTTEALVQEIADTKPGELFGSIEPKTCSTCTAGTAPGSDLKNLVELQAFKDRSGAVNDLTAQLKPDDELLKYLDCFKASAKLHQDYLAKYKDMIEKAAAAFEIPKVFLTCLLFRENQWYSDRTSKSGAEEIGQLLPGTKEEIFIALNDAQLEDDIVNLKAKLEFERNRIKSFTNKTNESVRKQAGDNIELYVNQIRNKTNSLQLRENWTKYLQARGYKDADEYTFPPAWKEAYWNTYANRKKYVADAQKRALNEHVEFDFNKTSEEARNKFPLSTVKLMPETALGPEISIAASAAYIRMILRDFDFKFFVDKRGRQLSPSTNGQVAAQGISGEQLLLLTGASYISGKNFMTAYFALSKDADMNWTDLYQHWEKMLAKDKPNTMDYMEGLQNCMKKGNFLPINDASKGVVCAEH